MSKKGLKTGKLFGVQVVSSPFEEVLVKIVHIIREKDYTKPIFVVTAYSEFFLEMDRNPRFREAVRQADLVLPDGVSIPAAREYLDLEKGNSIINGLKIGVRILMGKYKNRVTGVKLAEILLKLAVQNHYRVFLLGGWKGVAGRLAESWRDKGLNIQWDEGWPDIERVLTHTSLNKPVLEKINKFKPDLLLVSFGRFKQELWIHQQQENLRAGVVMGVGSAFDELAGEGSWKTPVPMWVEKRGLKWLWRVTRDHRHLKRAWNAFAGFGWKVYMEKRRKYKG